MKYVRERERELARSLGKGNNLITQATANTVKGDGDAMGYIMDIYLEWCSEHTLLYTYYELP